jgi:RNA polymerase sigma factor (TIGR02999 family)
MPESGNVTRLLQQASGGDRNAEEELFDLIKSDLQNIAAGALKGLRPGERGDAKFLAEDVFLRLVRNADTTWEHRGKFFDYASRKSHDLLVDRIRRETAQSRPPPDSQVDRDPDQLQKPTGQLTDDLNLQLDLRAALDSLQRSSAEAATAYRLRYLWQFTFKEIAEVLGIPEQTARNRWEYAQAWVNRELKDYHVDS